MSLLSTLDAFIIRVFVVKLIKQYHLADDNESFSDQNTEQDDEQINEQEVPDNDN